MFTSIMKSAYLLFIYYYGYLNSKIIIAIKRSFHSEQDRISTLCPVSPTERSWDAGQKAGSSHLRALKSRW